MMDDPEESGVGNWSVTNGVVMIVYLRSKLRR